MSPTKTLGGETGGQHPSRCTPGKGYSGRNCPGSGHRAQRRLARMPLLAALLALFLVAQEPSTPAAQGPIWLDDLGEAAALATESGRPLLVVFR